MCCGVTAPLVEEAEVKDRLVVLISPLKSTDIQSPKVGAQMDGREQTKRREERVAPAAEGGGTGGRREATWGMQRGAQ